MVIIILFFARGRKKNETVLINFGNAATECRTGNHYWVYPTEKECVCGCGGGEW